MDWVRDFYGTTGRWWGAAEGRISERDHRRVKQLHEIAGDAPQRVLELGCGYGTTAAATAQAGYFVTAIEISERAELAAKYASRDLGTGSLTVLCRDFYELDISEKSDVIAYWNGFGVGSDADQRRLLSLIHEWLQPDGVALIDISNPFVWAGWDQDEEHRMPDPVAGYEYELRERTTFDPVTCTAHDTWWDVADPENVITQTLRCYTPADLSLLLAGTGLTLDRIIVANEASLLRDEHEYLAVMRPTVPS